MAKTRRMNHDGSIKKRSDGRYEFAQMIDGVMRYASAKTLPELNDKIRKIKGTTASSGKLRVSEWNDKWLELYVKPLKRQATYDQYRYMVKHIDAVIGKRYIKGITPSDIQLVIARANESGAASSTLKHIRKVASCSFKRAVTDGVISEMPVVGIEIPAKTAKPRKTFTPIEVAKLRVALNGSRWKHSFNFALATGIRKGEMLAMVWSDIDLKNKIAVIDEALDRSGNVGDTKSAERHEIPLSKRAISALNEQRIMLLKEGNKAIYRKPDSKEAWVFPNQKGDALRPASYYDVISRAGKKNGFVASPHMLRHTFVRNSRGHIDIKDLQNILGHDESTTTIDIYGDILNDNTQKLASALDTAADKFEQDMANAIKEEEAKKKREDSRVVSFKKA